MPSKKQSDIPTVYQTHVLAKLHMQIKYWLHLKTLLKLLKGKDWMEWQLFPSSWCFRQSIFRQIQEMLSWIWAQPLEILFQWIIWFNLWNQLENQQTNQLANQSNEQSFQTSLHQNKESKVYRKSRMQNFQAWLLFRLLNLLPTPLTRLRQSMAWVMFTLNI